MLKKIQIALATLMLKAAAARYSKTKAFEDLEAIGYWRNRIYFLQYPNAIASAW